MGNNDEFPACNGSPLIHQPSTAPVSQPSRPHHHLLFPSPRPPPDAPPHPPPLAPGNQSPPPPAPFPFCNCNRTVGITAFSLDPSTTVTAGKDGPIYTWTVLSAPPVDPSSKCAATTLFKAEFWSSLSCFRAVKRAYINGKAVAPTWDSTYGVWKITSVNFAQSEVPGAVGTIGLELSATGSCPTLETLCNGSGGTCTYSLFDASKTCCPGGLLAIPL